MVRVLEFFSKGSFLLLLLSLALFLSCGTDEGKTNLLKLDVSTEGDIVTAIVRVENAKDLYGVAFDLVYDPAVLEYQSASEGDLLKSGGPTNFAAALQNGEPGRLVFGNSLVGAIIGIEGSSTIVSVNFQKIKTNCEVNEINIENAILINSKNYIIFRN